MLPRKRKPVTSSGQNLRKKLFGLQEKVRKKRVKQNHRKRIYRNLIIPVMCKFAVERYDFLFLLFKKLQQEILCGERLSVNIFYIRVREYESRHNLAEVRQP